MELYRNFYGSESVEEIEKKFKQDAAVDGRTRRVDADEVLSAFVRLGVKPEQGLVVCKDKRCGLTAVYESKGFALGDLKEFDGMLSPLGLSGHYGRGFMWGWDMSSEHPDEAKFKSFSPNWALGVDDGRSAWKACRHLAWPNTCRTAPQDKGADE